MSGSFLAGPPREADPGGKRGFWGSLFIRRSRDDGAGAFELEPTEENELSQPDADPVLIGLGLQPRGVKHLHTGCLPLQVSIGTA